MATRRFPVVKRSQYEDVKHAHLSEDTAAKLAELQAANGVNLGHPWIHTGFCCSGCSANPITGFLYKCRRREDYYLCEKCYRQHSPEERQEYSRFERSFPSPPYQMWCIQCEDCKVAPIQGPRFRHKTRSKFNLCAACFAKRQAMASKLSDHYEPLDSYELLEDTTVKSARKMHSTVFHYGQKCDGCKSSPIFGPRYCLKFENSSQENLVSASTGTPTEVNLCLICFDDQFGNHNHKDSEDRKALAKKFRKVSRPEGRSAAHVEMVSCRNCNATPICGPAFLNLSKDNCKDALCLFCFLNLKREKRDAYERLDPPRQLNPGEGNMTEAEVKSYLSRRKPASGGEEALMEAAMAAQRRQQFRYKLWNQVQYRIWNQVKHNLRSSHEIDHWNLKIENDDGSWSWADP